MEEGLIKVEENQLIIANKLKNQIIKLEKNLKILKESESNLKEKLYDTMKQNNIKSFESNDKSIRITLSPDTISTSFDLQRFQEDNPKLYREYLKETNKKGSIRITIRGDKDE